MQAIYCRIIATMVRSPLLHLFFLAPCSFCEPFKKAMRCQFFDQPLNFYVIKSIIFVENTNKNNYHSRKIIGTRYK